MENGDERQTSWRCETRAEEEGGADDVETGEAQGKEEEGVCI